MINIQAVYGKYDELIAEFGEQEIQEQISCLLLQCKEFITINEQIQELTKAVRQR